MNAPAPTPPGVLRMGWIAGTPIYVARSWFLVAFLIAFLLGPRIERVTPSLGSLAYVGGLAFAVLLYLSVLLHEISHALTAQGFGMPVRSVTLHFLGGVTEIESEAETPRREFWVSVVGPLTSGAVGIVSLLVSRVVPEGLIEFTLQSLAAANLVISVVNILPGLPLDGGKVLRAAVWAATGKPHLATVVAAWGGRVVAVAALGYPFAMQAWLDVEPTLVDYLVAVLIAGFLWSGASRSLAMARLRARLPSLHARAIARRVLAVSGDLPLAEAVRRADEAGAGGLVVVDGDGRPTALVVEQAVAATPVERRACVTTDAVARRLQAGTVLPADLGGEALVRAINAAPASEYLLVEPDGSVHGLLVTTDVDRELSRT